VAVAANAWRQGSERKAAVAIAVAASMLDASCYVTRAPALDGAGPNKIVRGAEDLVVADGRVNPADQRFLGLPGRLDYKSGLVRIEGTR